MVERNKIFLATIILCLLIVPLVCASQDTQTDSKAKLVIGISLIIIAFALFAKTDETAFFVVFASQGLIQIIEYLL